MSGDDAEIDEVGAFGADQRRKRKAVRIDDLAGSRLGAGRHQFVAGREQRHLGLAINRHQRMVHAGNEREVARGQPMAFGEQLVALAEIEPLRADIAAFGGRPTIQPEFAAAAAGRTEISKGDDERKEKLKKEFAAAAKGQETTGERGGESRASKAAAAFNRRVTPSATTKGDLQRAFEQAKDIRRKPSSSSGQQEHTEELDPEKREQAREAKEDAQRRKPPPPGPERDREK